MNIRGWEIAMRVVIQWNVHPQKLGSPSSEMLKIQLDNALSNLIQLVLL